LFAAYFEPPFREPERIGGDCDDKSSEINSSGETDGAA
jgi:hypothetical protein